MGVRTVESAEAQATRLGELFDAHRYSRGLAFVAQGTATNNSGERRSDYPAATPDAASLAVARGPGRAGPDTDGGRLAAALGIDAAAFDHVARAGADEQRAARAMVEALWPATVGYFLDQIPAPEVGPDTIAAVRAWMRDWVRPRGRCRRYGWGTCPTACCRSPRSLPGSPGPTRACPPPLPGLLGRLAHDRGNDDRRVTAGGPYR